MRLFWKHVARSFLRRPLQPLLILLTVICSTAVIVAGLQLSVVFTDHSREVAERDREIGDVLITMRGDSDVRMLFSEDAERVLGESGSVIGEFRLSGFWAEEAQDGESEENFINLSALDLEAADAFYQFQYTDYGVFTEKNLATSAIISEKMAKKYDLSVGDIVKIRVLDTDYSYTVQAIARESALLMERDMLVSIESLRQTLAARNPAIASLGASFSPATRLAIRVDGDCSADEICTKLLADPAFAQMNVSVTGDDDMFLFLALVQNIVLWLPCVLLLLLGALMQISCMSFLHAQRSEETALFCAVGASRRHLFALTVGESGLYGLIGSLIALPVAAMLLQFASGLYEWVETVITPKPLICLVGCALSLALLLGCTVRHFASRRTLSLAEALQHTSEMPDEGKKGAWILPAALLALSALTLLFLPTRLHYVSSLALIFTSVWLAYLLLFPYFKKAATLLQHVLNRASRPHGWMMMGVKNLHGCFALRHVGRVMTLFFALYATLTFSIGVLQTQLDGLLESVSADCLAVYADERAVQELEACPDVERVMQMSYFPMITLEDEYTVIGISSEGDPTGMIGLDCYPKDVPTGDKIAISKGLSVLIGKGVGDRVRLSVEGVSQTFTISEILRTNMHVTVFDVEALGMKHGYLCINTTPDADVAKISAVLEARGAFLVDDQIIFSTVGQSVTAHVALLRGMIRIAVGMILLGSVNLLIRQYRERQNERRILMMSGMARREILAMYVWELLLLLTLSALAAVAVAGLLCVLLDIGVRSFGMVLLL